MRAAGMGLGPTSRPLQRSGATASLGRQAHLGGCKCSTPCQASHQPAQPCKHSTRRKIFSLVFWRRPPAARRCSSTRTGTRLWTCRPWRASGATARRSPAWSTASSPQVGGLSCAGRGWGRLLHPHAEEGSQFYGLRKLLGCKLASNNCSCSNMLHVALCFWVPCTHGALGACTCQLAPKAGLSTSPPVLLWQARSMRRCTSGSA
jgi:hypothetical protein